MTQQALLATTFIAAIIAGSAIMALLLDVCSRNSARIRSRLRESHEHYLPAQNSGTLFKDFGQLAPDMAPPLPGLWNRFQDLIAQAGLPVSAHQVLAGILGISCSCALVAGIASGAWWAAMLAGMSTILLSIVSLNVRSQRRRDRLCRQLPEAFDLMSRAIRAGQTMSGAFQIVARDLQPPLSIEFNYCYEQQNLGRPPDLALRDMARRTGVLELQMFVVAMLVQRQSGGNIAELLGNLASVVRKRIALKGRVKALTGEGRMQALVLTLLPAAVFVSLIVLNRSYVQTLLDKPVALGVVLGCQFLGGLWIRHIVNLEY